MELIIAAYVGIDNNSPVWISAASFVVAGLVFLVLPYESRAGLVPNQEFLEMIDLGYVTCICITTILISAVDYR